MPFLRIAMVLACCLTLGTASHATEAEPTCSDEGAWIEVAANDQGLIVSRTTNSVRVAPGTRVQIVQRGRTTVALLNGGATARGGGDVSCTCSRGTCFPSDGGDRITCTSHAGECTSGCGVIIRSGPPPAPDPAPIRPGLQARPGGGRESEGRSRNSADPKVKAMPSAPSRRSRPPDTSYSPGPIRKAPTGGERGLVQLGVPGASNLFTSVSGDKVRFAPGVQAHETQRGGQTVLELSGGPGGPGSKVYMSCNCKGSGSCKPSTKGSSAVCVSSSCDESCEAVFQTPPPPAPN